MAIEEKVRVIQAEIKELDQKVQQLLTQLETPDAKVVQPEDGHEPVAANETMTSILAEEEQTRPLNPQNLLVKSGEYGLQTNGYPDIMVEAFDEQGEDFFEDLIDFFPTANKTNGNKDELDHELMAQLDVPVESIQESTENASSVSSEYINTWQDLEIDHWINETYPQTDSCYKQFCFLFHWIEETVEYIGQEKMLRTLNLYNRHNYIPDKVYQLLRDVIQLMPKSQPEEEGNTHEIINSLMELNGMLEGDIRIGMNELMEIVGEN